MSPFLCIQKCFINVSPEGIPSIFFMLYALFFNLSSFSLKDIARIFAS